MQERQGVVPQERDVSVIDERRQIECVSEERGQEVPAAGEKRQEKELDDIEMEIEGEEGPIGNLIDSIVSHKCLLVSAGYSHQNSIQTPVDPFPQAVQITLARRLVFGRANL